MRTARTLFVLAAALLLGAVPFGCTAEPAPTSPTSATPTSVTPTAAAPTTVAADSATPGSSGPATSAPSAARSYVTVDVQAAHEALSANAAAQIVDIREPSEWTATGVPVGAVLIPLGQLEQRAPEELAKDQPVYVLCNSGNRSRTGSELLLKLGYAEVYNVDGGIQDWLRAGLPVETYAP